MTQDEHDRSPQQPLPPGPSPAPVRPLNYVRPGVVPPGEVKKPIVAGFGIGIGLTVGTLAAMGWVMRETGGRSPGLLLAVVFVGLVAAAMLEGRYRFRGVLAGIGFTLGMLVLIGCVGIWLLCGGTRRW